jgi:hypothetical protein
VPAKRGPPPGASPIWHRAILLPQDRDAVHSLDVAGSGHRGSLLLTSQSPYATRSARAASTSLTSALPRGGPDAMTTACSCFTQRRRLRARPRSRRRAECQSVLSHFGSPTVTLFSSCATGLPRRRRAGRGLGRTRIRQRQVPGPRRLHHRGLVGTGAVSAQGINPRPLHCRVSLECSSLTARPPRF